MTQTISVTMSLTPQLVDRLDRQRRLFFQRFGWLSRSALVRLAVVEWLDRNENGSEATWPENGPVAGDTGGAQ
jgi:hypothetical protein